MLPSVAWVPAAIIWFGLSDATVYFVILMGAIPSIVNGLIAGIDQVPPQLRRVGTVLGASRAAARDARHPARRPSRVRRGTQAGLGVLVALAHGRRDHRDGRHDRLRPRLDAAEQTRDLADLAGVLGTILVILTIGILIELLFFGPLERRMLRGRGLLQAVAR